MKREKKPSASASGIPQWFMTYTDVITVMMTFFILLMTFANSEPENFDLMQQSLFGSGGSAGIVGNRTSPIDQPAVLLRVRPPASRVTVRGSQMPPLSTDPVTEAVGKGLKSLEEQAHQFEREVAFDVSQPLFIDGKGELTSIAAEHLKMIAVQLQRLPMEFRIIVGDQGDASAAVTMASHMTTALLVPPGKISVEVAPAHSLPETGLRLVLTKQE